MASLNCNYRDHIIIASIFEHPGLPTPWAAGCRITSPDGHTSTRKPLPARMAFMADLDSAQHAAIAHGKWLVDQRLDSGREVF
ncbi:MAG: hypothetical protein GAK45_01893 [Pseudomonas citronellolis]|nr:MAG: hypothetical protein GAK45_01893 [Pseudomonas citronellolis]